jgi:hypothetical protein
MAFCNSCGGSIAPGTSFCNKCGVAIAGAAPASNAAPAAGSTLQPGPMAPPSSRPGGSTMKTVLIIVGVVVLVGVLGLVSLGLVAWRIARHSHIQQEGGNVKVETPFGTVQTTMDPQVAAGNVGVELYPGAQVSQGSATATFGGIHSASLNAESTDSLDKVANFYKAMFPNATVMTTRADSCTIVSSSNDSKNVVTISIKTERDKTRIMISRVTRNSDAATPSSN